MENTLDTKKWKQKKEDTKKIIQKTPKNEHMVYFVDFKAGVLEKTEDHSNQENLLTFGKPNKPRKPRKSKKNEQDIS